MTLLLVAVLLGFAFLNFLDVGYLRRAADIQTCLLYNIRKDLQTLMSAITDLQALVDAAVSAAKTAFTDVAAKLDALAAQITDLQAQVAAGSTVSAADLAAVSADLTAQSSALTDAAAAIEAKIAPAPPAPPAQ